MLDRIGTKGFESNSKASPEALLVLRRVVSAVPSPVVAEIGTGIGATTLEMVRAMHGNGTLYLFDFADRVDELVGDLEALDDARGLDIVAMGNTRKTYDGYAWSLARMVRDLRSAGKPLATFDFVYLDGAHAFQHDAPACALLKELVKPGGYLVFDDMYWTFNKSPVMNPVNKPAIKNDYTDDQLDIPHIEMVVTSLVETDPRFEQELLTANPRPYRPVFRRVRPPTPPAPRTATQELLTRVKARPELRPLRKAVVAARRRRAPGGR